MGNCGHENCGQENVEAPPGIAEDAGPALKGARERAEKVARASLLVCSKYRERLGTRRKVNHLFDADGVSYFRVNYIQLDDGLIQESHWVRVIGDDVLAD